MSPAPHVPPRPVPTEPIPSLPRSTAGFHLRRELGRGGMGIVYEAQEISTGRTVALKVLLQDLALSNEAMERFQREARLAAAISHAHCVFVYGAHSVEGAPAIAMELIGGQTLEDKIRRGEPFPIETAVRWTMDLLDGLEAAHRAGVLHRDVKPSNCFVTMEGRVKVGDFGLSRSLERDIQLTQSGQFLGSPLYASPEQIRGRALDARSDLYSCGATLYAILTGRPPFSGGNVGEVLARILSEEPPHPRSIRPEIPRALEAVVLRAMERDPEKRFRDLHEFRDALEPFATVHSAIAAPWRRIGAYVIDSAVIEVLCALVIFAAKALDVDLFVMGAQSNLRPSPLGHGLMSLIILLYFGLAEGLLGYGLGKWLLGLRVVWTDTRESALGPAMLRAAVFVVPTGLFGIVIAMVAPDSRPLAILGGIVPFVILIILFSTARRRNSWRGIHEFASNTVVLPVAPPFLRARFQAPPPETACEPNSELPASLGDYAVEGVIGQTSNGRMLKARDASLERSVWIHLPEVEAALAGEERRALSRPGRLRWLGVVSTRVGEGDVYESPGGCSLPMFRKRHGRIDWPNAQRLLLALVEELKAKELELGGNSSAGQASAGHALDQVWIDRNWDLRLLDEPVGHPPFARHPPVGLVREAARALFLGTEDGTLVLPPDLPVHAEMSVTRLMSDVAPFEDLAAVRDALMKLSSGPAIVQQRTRGAQLSINVFLPAAILFVMVVGGVIIGSLFAKSRGVSSMLGELDTGRIDMGEDTTAEQHAESPPLSDDQRRAREILVAYAFTAFGANLIEAQMNPKEHALIDAALALHPEPSEQEIQWAEGTVRAETGRTAHARQKNVHKAIMLIPAAVMGLVGVGLWGMIALPLALILRGGLTFLLFGIRVRNRRGEPASRILCFVRCLLCWLPLALGSVAVYVLTDENHVMAAAIVAGVMVLIYLAALFDAVLHPAQCAIDRLLKTRLVPR